jgi:hypothetical protein
MITAFSCPMNAQEPAKIQITKLDAARRQLETAITLWFNDDDPVSVHTLTAAAHKILYDLNKHRGGTPMLHDVEIIRPEKRRKCREAFLKAENFFKHADHDPGDTHLFSPAATPFRILEAAEKYGEMVGLRTAIMQTFFVYFGLICPDVFKADISQKLRALASDQELGLSKRQFWSVALPVFNRMLAARKPPQNQAA